MTFKGSAEWNESFYPFLRYGRRAEHLISEVFFDHFARDLLWMCRVHPYPHHIPDSVGVSELGLGR